MITINALLKKLGCALNIMGEVTNAMNIAANIVTIPNLCKIVYTYSTRNGESYKYVKNINNDFSYEDDYDLDSSDETKSELAAREIMWVLSEISNVFEVGFIVAYRYDDDEDKSIPVYAALYDETDGSKWEVFPNLTKERIATVEDSILNGDDVDDVDEDHEFCSFFN